MIISIDRNTIVLLNEGFSSSRTDSLWRTKKWVGSVICHSSPVVHLPPYCHLPAGVVRMSSAEVNSAVDYRPSSAVECRIMRD